MKSVYPAVFVGIVIGLVTGITLSTPYGKMAFKSYCERKFNENLDQEFKYKIDKKEDSAMFYKGKLTSYFEMQFYKP